MIKSKQKIIVTYECPPIPTKRYDWRAAYVGCEEDNNDGFGETPQEAVGELINNYAE